MKIIFLLFWKNIIEINTILVLKWLLKIGKQNFHKEFLLFSFKHISIMSVQLFIESNGINAGVFIPMQEWNEISQKHFDFL